MGSTKHSPINLYNFNDQRDFRAYDVKAKFSKTIVFSQRLVDYLGPK